VEKAAIVIVQFGVPQDSVLQTRTFQTSVVLRDASGLEVTGRTPTYESLDPDVAAVDTKGLVTARAVGQATIKATIDGRSGQMVVKVLERVATVIVTPSTDQVAINQSRALSATVTGSSGQAIAGRVVTWSSGSPAVATVSAQGLVSGISLGPATITARVAIDNIAGTSAITVVNVPVASVVLSPFTQQVLRLGGSLQVTATPRDANNNPLTGRPVTWISSNPIVATVSSSGLVTPVSVGQTNITAEVDGRLSQGLQVTVTEIPPKTVTVTPDTVALLTANTRVLASTVVDSLNRTLTTLANRTVVWSSNTPSIATVSQTGTVTGVTAGTARVSLTVDGVKSNDVIVNVADQVISVQITPNVIPPMRVGNTLQLAAQALNNLAQPIPGKVANWVSSNPTVATVSSTGLVTFHAVGGVNITAQIDQRTAVLNINVTPVPIGTVTLTPANDTLAGGDSRQYTPVVTDSAGRPVTSLANRTVLWVSSSQLVATVGGAGIVQGTQSQNGTTTITVTIDNVVSNPLTLRVAQITGLAVTPISLSVTIGTPKALAVLAKDIDGNTLTTTRQATFTTSNPLIATVTPAGVVSGVTAGTANILVQMQGVPSTTVAVTVTP
jgi:uncharacterized protein YjdB